MAKALSIDTRLQLVEMAHEDFNKVLHGNGREGLVAQVAKIEGSVNSIEKSANLLTVTAQSLQTGQTKFVARTVKDVTRLDGSLKAIGKTANAAHSRLKKVEKDLKKITDFKTSLLIRVSTIVSVYGGLTVAAALAWRYRHQILEMISK